MCLAIVKPADATIPPDNFKQGWISNPDGGGYGFIDKNGNTVVRKGFSKLKEMEDAYAVDVKQYADSPFLVHFRICTMGAKDEDNTHPFSIENGLLIHNGTISGTAAVYGSGKSDTALFAESVSKHFTYDFVKQHAQELNDILSYNKVAVLFKDKRYAILNESKGYWDGGVWYSNRGYVRYSGRNSYNFTGD